MLKTVFAAILSGFMAMIALGCIGISGFASWQFWSAMASDDLGRLTMGGAAIALDGLKALLPLALAFSFANRRFWHVKVGSILFVCLVAFSFASAVGYVAKNRSGATADIASINAQLRSTQKETAELERRISGYPKLADAHQIEASIAAMRENRRWATTKQCADATATASREFCAEYHKARGDLATAIRVEADRGKLDILRQTERRLQAAGAGREANPQATTIAQLIPDSSASDVEFAIRIAFAGLIEAGAAFGLFLAFGHGGTSPRKPAKSASAVRETPAMAAKTEVAKNPDIPKISDFRKVPLLLPDDDAIDVDWNTLKEESA